MTNLHEFSVVACDNFFFGDGKMKGEKNYQTHVQINIINSSQLSLVKAKQKAQVGY